MAQVFPIGTVVKVVEPHIVWEVKHTRIRKISIDIDRVGKLAVIVGTYSQMYPQSGVTNDYDYAIVYCDGSNMISWLTTKQLRFIADGGKEFLAECMHRLETR